MRNRCRRRTRTARPVVLDGYSRLVCHFAYIQDSGAWREWSFRQISHRQAQNLLAAGEVERVIGEKDGVVQVVGYRALSPTRWERPSPCTLTLQTSLAVAQSDDPELTRRQRNEILKFKVWALIGDEKAVAVRPRISAADRRIAENLLRPPAAWMVARSGLLAA